MSNRQLAMPNLGRTVKILGALAALFAARCPLEAGFKINATYDSSINSLHNATQVKGVINEAIKFYESTLTDNITVNITFQNISTGLGQSTKPLYSVSYTNYLKALTKDSTSASDVTALANLPTQFLNPVTNQSQMFVSQANLKALGFKVGTGTDGIVGLNTSQMFTSTIGVSPSKYDMYATVAHEINEVLGLGSGIGFTGILAEDLFRYDAAGARSFTANPTAAAYFSIDGVTRRARFNQTAGGDYGDWYSIVAHTPQINDAFATPGVIVSRKMTNELLALDVLGYNIRLNNSTIVSGLTGATYYGMRTTNMTPQFEPAAVPEPSSIVMLLLGCLGGGGFAFRRRAIAA